MPRTLQRRETGVRKRAVSANGDYQEDQEFLRPHDDLPSSPLSFSQLSAAPAVAVPVRLRMSWRFEACFRPDHETILFSSSLLCACPAATPQRKIAASYDRTAFLFSVYASVMTVSLLFFGLGFCWCAWFCDGRLS